MHTAERKKLSVADVMSLKQASMARTLEAAREAMANGTLKKRPRPAGIPYTMELRVKPA